MLIPKKTKLTLMDLILTISGLTKDYGKIRAVDNLNLNVPRGSVFGILGPNGSGKTTTLSIVLGAVQPTSGSFSWFGNGNDLSVRKQIGSLLERPNFLPYLNAIDNLRMIASIKGVEESRIDECLKQTGLFERRKSRYKTYSFGMKQRLGIAGVLLADPEVLVLDEPTNGLDPQGIIEIRELIIELSRQGKTILLASHILDEVEKVCTHAAILKTGKLMHQYETGKQAEQFIVFEIGTSDLAGASKFLNGIQGIVNITEDSGYLKVQAESTVSPGDINKLMVESGYIPDHLRQIKQSLESAFLSATGDKK
jgi:ABC-2 type transport system ATP-binding protein